MNESFKLNFEEGREMVMGSECRSTLHIKRIKAPVYQKWWKKPFYIYLSIALFIKSMWKIKVMRYAGQTSHLFHIILVSYLFKISFITAVPPETSRRFKLSSYPGIEAFQILYYTTFWYSWCVDKLNEDATLLINWMQKRTPKISFD